MSTSKFGKWVRNGYSEPVEGRAIYCETYGVVVAVVPELEGNRDLEIARLVSAAPELLEALKNLGDWLAYGLSKADGAQPNAEELRTCERLAAAARAAVDKAEGPRVAL